MVVAGRLVLAGECRVRVCFVVCVPAFRVLCRVSSVPPGGSFVCLFVKLHVAEMLRCTATKYLQEKAQTA